MPDHSEFNIEIADLNIRLLCDYPYTKKLCEGFIVESDNIDLIVRTSDDEILTEQGNYNDRIFPEGYCESICLYRAIAEKMPEFDGFVFHGAAVEINGAGCVFTAQSGVGKTTHISLLLNKYRDNAEIINGDKPIIRFMDSVPYVCSTPWAGKEGMKRNTSAPLRAIILLERSENNFIEEVSPADYFDAIMRQVYLPVSSSARILTFDLIDELAESVKFFRLGCNMEESAADTSYGALCEL